MLLMLQKCVHQSSPAKALCRRKRSGMCSNATPLVSWDLKRLEMSPTLLDHIAWVTSGLWLKSNSECWRTQQYFQTLPGTKSLMYTITKIAFLKQHMMWQFPHFPKPYIFIFSHVHMTLCMQQGTMNTQTRWLCGPFAREHQCFLQRNRTCEGFLPQNTTYDEIWRNDDEDNDE